MKEYKTIKSEAQAEIVVKKSHFIGYAKPIETAEEAMDFVAKIKKKNHDATHNVFAYILKDGQSKRCSDDGEPQGTAGVPMLDFLEKEEIVDCVVVVTRYFGGILLGTGGLIRAYTEGAKAAVEQAKVVHMRMCTRVKVHTDYNTVGKILYELTQRGLEQDDSEYTDVISLTVTMPSNDVENFVDKITQISAGKSCTQVIEEVFYPIEQ